MAADPQTLPATMRALEYRRRDGLGCLTLRTDCPLPTLGPNDLLLRVKYAGVCGSDLHILAGTSCYAERVILGHEMVGVVAAVGENVIVQSCSSWEIGEAVTLCPQFSCGTCRPCQLGRTNFCENGGYDSTIGYWSDGCFADFVSVHSSQVYRKIPEHLSFEKAVLSEPFNCLLNGMKKLGSAVGLPDARVLIIGGGIFGLLWTAMLFDRGLKRITLTELKAGRRKIAQNFASKTLRLSSARILHSDELLPHETFDIVIECCGQAEAVEIGYSHLDIGGTLLIFGGPSKNSRISIDPSDILFKEITIKGTVIGQQTFEEGMQALADLDKKGYLDWTSLGVQFFAFNEWEKARQMLEEGSICKAIFSTER